MVDIGGLPLAPLTISSANGINDAGAVVGKSYFELPTICLINAGTDPICHQDDFSDKAFLWLLAEGMLQLDTLIDSSDSLFGGLSLTSSYDINNMGWIVANGYLLTGGGGNQHAFLLIPSDQMASVPEPGSFWLMLFGTVVLFGFVRTSAPGARRRRQ